MKPLESFIGSPLAGAIGWTILHSLWEGAAIAALLAASLIAVRSPRARYVAACTAMFALVAVFAVTLTRMMPTAAGNFPRFSSAVRFVAMPSAAPQEGAARNWTLSLAAIAPWLTPFWIVGVCLLSVHRFAGYLSLRRLSRRGVCCPPELWRTELMRLSAQLKVSRPVRLLESCLAEVPMVLGHFRPVILMPLGLLTGLPAEQVEAILLHELAHIRRADFLVNLCQRLIEGLLFYHPAVWWISKVIRNEREICCDDVVISISQRTHEYALALAALERNRISGREAAVAATGGTLVKRIHRLLYPKAPAGIWSPLVAVAILIATASIAVAALHPKSSQLNPVAVQTQPANPIAAILQPLAQPLAAKQAQVETSRSSQPIPQATHPAIELKPVSSAPISIKITEDSGSIYRTIAALAGLNVQFDPSFTSRRISIELAGVSVEQALDATSLLSGNQWTAIGSDTFLVGSATAIRTSSYSVVYARLASQLQALGSATPPQQTTVPAQYQMAQPGPSATATAEPSKTKLYTFHSMDAQAQSPDTPTQATIFLRSGGTFATGTNIEVMELTPYTKWLNEDVAYIITDEERDTFLHLGTDEERDQFINAFWERRNPEPGSSDNKFKDEHYRRIAYANSTFAAGGKPGLQTDRGHMYIVYGVPDEIDINTSMVILPGNETQAANPTTQLYPHQLWRYKHIDGIGDNLVFEFVNRGNGAFTLAPAPETASPNTK
jgi:GWxTD domain-containing protein